MPDEIPKAALKRSLSLPLITLYGLGTIIGAGIYVLIGAVTAHAGLHAPIAFLVAAIVAGFTAFTYAELTARYPFSGAEAVYLQAAFARAWLSQLIGWAVVAVGVISSAALANGFAGYLEVFFIAPRWLVIVLLTAGLGFMAVWGISQSAWLAAVITLIEVAGLIFVIVVAGDSLVRLPQMWESIAIPADASAWLGISLGAFVAFYAFIGFEDMVNVAEEVKNPTRNLPLAIILALAISTVLYVLVALVAVTALPVSELANSRAPLAKIIEYSGTTSPLSIAAISLIAVINGALIQTIMATRMIYGMAQTGLAPVWFGVLHPGLQTPLRATLVTVAAVLFFALWLPLITLAKLTSFVTLIVFAAVNLALVRIKLADSRTAKRLANRSDSMQSGDRDSKGLAANVAQIRVYPLWVSITGAALCVLLIAFQLIEH